MSNENIIISSEIESLMSRRGIFHKDIERVFRWLREGRAGCVRNEDSTEFLVKAAIAMTTYYVEYRMEDGNYVVLDLYCHGTSIVSDE